MIDETVEQEIRHEKIKGIRELMDFLEANPNVPFPSMGDFSYWGATKEEIITSAKAFGTCEKNFLSTVFELKKNFGRFISFDINASRETVCEKVVIGTEEVPEQIIPEKIIPASIKEVVEWKCLPILAETEKIAEEVK